MEKNSQFFGGCPPGPTCRNWETKEYKQTSVTVDNTKDYFPPHKISANMLRAISLGMNPIVFVSYTTKQ
jgi:hypothetical protein